MAAGLVIELRTSRLRMRRARPDDVDAFFAVMRDEETMRYWSTLPHADVETTRRWVESMVSASPETSDDFVLEHEGEVIGKLGSFRLPDVGFILRRDRWGRGLMIEAGEAFVAHVFAARPTLAALTADVDPRNVASLKLLARLGFVETHRAERTYEIGGVWTDSVYLRRPR